MFKGAGHEDEASFVGHFCTPAADDDYDRHLAGERALFDHLRSGGGRRAMAILIIQDAGYPPPSALTRQKVAELTSSPGYVAFTAIVSSSRVLRNVVTAINWIRGRSNDERFFESVDDALDWLEAQRGERLSGLRGSVRDFGVARERRPD